MAVEIILEDLTERISAGWKKKQLAEFYGLPITQMTKVLQQEGLRIRKTHYPKYVIVRRGEETPEEVIEETITIGDAQAVLSRSSTTASTTNIIFTDFGVTTPFQSLSISGGSYPTRVNDITAEEAQNFSNEVFVPSPEEMNTVEDEGLPEENEDEDFLDLEVEEEEQISPSTAPENNISTSPASLEGDDENGWI